MKSVLVFVGEVVVMTAVINAGACLYNKWLTSRRAG